MVLILKSQGKGGTQSSENSAIPIKWCADAGSMKILIEMQNLTRTLFGLHGNVMQN